jgi:hypothetical protein|tara:strand:+ start:499 stop:666 length:168 start_codon:yes stop_codon:yes gene_type:complete
MEDYIDYVNTLNLGLVCGLFYSLEDSNDYNISIASHDFERRCEWAWLDYSERPYN